MRFNVNNDYGMYRLRFNSGTDRVRIHIIKISKLNIILTIYSS